MLNRVKKIRTALMVRDALTDIRLAVIHVRDGGPGSGNFGHVGRPGKVGGSAPEDGAGGTANAGAAVKGRIYSAEGFKHYADWASLPKLPKPKKQPDSFMASRREEHNKMVADRAESLGVPKNIVKRLHEHLGSMSGRFMSAISSALDRTKFTVEVSDRPSFYSFYKKEIVLATKPPNKQDSRTEYSETNTFHHELGHAIDDAYGISMHDVDSGRFDKSAETDVNAFLKDAVGGTVIFKGRKMYNAKTGKEIVRGSPEADELTMKSVDYIKKILGRDAVTDYWKKHEVPQWPNYEDYMETFNKGNGFVGMRERYPGAEAEYKAHRERAREAESAFIREHPELKNKLEPIAKGYDERMRSVSHFADALCSASNGTLNLFPFLGGHAQEYYDRSKYIGSNEVFSNWFASVTTRDELNYGLIERYLPTLTADYKRYFKEE